MWTSRSEDRLREWKEFRRRIGELPFDEAVKETVKLWSYAPFVTHHLDHYDPKDWPTPWELLSENTYDEMAKAMCMIYTLHLSKHGKEHAFSMVSAEEGSTLSTFHLAWIDEGKYILNYQFNEVISKEQLDSELKIVKTYSAIDLKLPSY